LPRLRAWLSRHERALLVAFTVLFSAALLLAYDQWRIQPAAPTQDDIDDAVLHTLSQQVIPAQETRAFNAVIGSVVMVRGENDEPQGGSANPRRKPSAGAPGAQGPAGPRSEQTPADKGGSEPAEERLPDVAGIGTGVVLVDSGVILTNLHVVTGAQRIMVTFADGSESRARIVGLRPEQDLAVLQARTVPEGLKAATVKPSTELQPGERVIAVGFPFGIGPSVSSGVVSGLNREFRSKQGREKLQNLIQFDAAANPGNSGGPLVTMDGSVVGIVTAILNPTEDRVFVGIGFAVPIESAAAAAGSSPF